MLTRNGWVVVFVAAAATLGVVTGIAEEAAVVAVGAVAVLLPGLVWRMRRLAPYQLDLTVAPTAVHRGDQATVTIGLRAGGRGMMPVAQVALSACGASVARLLRPRGQGEVCSVRAARRGRQAVSLAVLTCRDPLGLWRRRVPASVRVAGTRIISVLPRFTPLREQSRLEDVRSVRVTADDPATPVATVHRGCRTVLLDVHRHPFDPATGRDDPFELAVDVTFSLLRSATLAGLEVSLLTNAAADAGPYRDLTTITEVLTGVRPCAAYPGCAAAPALRALVRRHDLAGGHPGGRSAGVAVEGGTVVVSTAPDAATVLAPLATAATGSRPILFQVNTLGPDRRRDRSGVRVLEVSSLGGAARAWAEEMVGP